LILGSLAIVLWNGTIALGSILPGLDNKSCNNDTTDIAERNPLIHEEEFPADSVDYYQYSSPEVEAASGEENPPLKWYTMITKLPSDWSSFASNTFRSESIPAIAGVVGLTGIFYIADNSTYQDMSNYAKGSPRLQSLNSDFIDVGDGRYELGFMGAFAVYGFLTDDSRAIRTASQMTEAFLATGAVVQVLKHISGRESPAAATSQRGTISLFPSLSAYQHNQPKYYSFPSGHIATTSASLTVLCENFPEVTWLQPVSYLTLGAVGASLVSKGMHWYSDLPLGVALGYSFGAIAARTTSSGSEARNSVDGKPYELSLEPAFNSSGAGINIAVHF
jgi:membrane-associated phospholipid phosphatase